MSGADLRIHYLRASPSYRVMMQSVMIAGAAHHAPSTGLAFAVEIAVKAARALPALHFLFFVLSEVRHLTPIVIALLSFHVSEQ